MRSPARTARPSPSSRTPLPRCRPASVHRVLEAELGPRLARAAADVRRRPGGRRVDRPGAPRDVVRRHRSRGQDPVPRCREGAPLGPAPGGPTRAAVQRHRARPSTSRAIVEELQDRVVEELDYRLEAESQSIFAEEFADDPEIVVPSVVAHTEQVLVTTWLESDHSLAEVITNGTQEERNTYGESYVRFLFAGPARTGLLHADPHPGNYRIMPDGRLGCRRLRRRGPAARRCAARGRPAAPCRRRRRLRGRHRRSARDRIPPPGRRDSTPR